MTKYFIQSTAIPFLLIVVISGNLFQLYYNRQILRLTSGYLQSASQNISMYIKDLEQVIFMPFFDNKVISLLSQFSKQESVSFTDQTLFDNEFGNLISSIRYISNDFYSALIVNNDKTIYSSSNFNTAEPVLGYNWSEESWYQQAIEAKGRIVFIPPHTADYYTPEDSTERISLVCTISNLVTRNPYAVIKIDFLPSTIASLFEDLDFNVPFIAYAVDSADNIIFQTSSDKHMSKMIKTEISDSLIKYAGYNEKQVNHLQKRIESTPYTLHILLDRAAAIRYTLNIYAAGIGLYIIAFLISLMLDRKLAKRISEPVSAINETLAKVEKGDFEAEYTGKPNWELDEIGASLNHMISDLKETIDKKYVAELAKEKAENKALLSQISPHFLFNTLNTLIALLYDKKYIQLENALYNLSDLLHYVLRKDSMVKTSQELDFLRAYLLLQQERFQNKLEFNIACDEKAKDTTIPRLILQPFVENSIIHGMEPMDKGEFTIDIFAKIANSVLTLSVKDNGVGFDPLKTDFSSSIGVENCLQRIRLLDKNAEIKIESAPQKGCEITIKINLVNEVKNESTNG